LNNLAGQQSSGNSDSRRTRTKPGSRPVRSPQSARGVRAIVLVGFMGAGKTSVGKALGQRLGWPFEDLDDRIQARMGHTIEQVFRNRGESDFRRAETAALRELFAEPGPWPRVVALGGGAFVRSANTAVLKKAQAHTIFLDAQAQELFRRCELDGVRRPLLRDLKQFRQLYEQRRPHYLKAGLRIQTSGKNVADIAVEVACSLGIS
jgi:shikimate kinase